MTANVLIAFFSALAGTALVSGHHLAGMFHTLRIVENIYMISSIIDEAQWPNMMYSRWEIRSLLLGASHTTAVIWPLKRLHNSRTLCLGVL